jgi:SAM-dependent methyltransferase
MTFVFKHEVPEGLNRPEQLPGSDDERKRWQDANRSFWQANPMRYDWKRKVGHEEFSEAFFREIDDRFFSDVVQFMPWQRIPFDTLIDFDRLGTQDVLEIGVGNGSHAQLLATRAKSFTGIDLTDYAVHSTSRRMRMLDLETRILQMDAERLTFPDAAFDFIWSWGVIHHSANTERILQEMLRVLRPGGAAVTMVYHRGWWNYYLRSGLISGLILGDLFKSRSLFKTVQRHTDGALARYYTPRTWRALVERQGFAPDYVVVKGSKSDVFPIPGGKAKDLVMRAMPNALARFLTNRCRMGAFLISRIVKPELPGG